MRNLMGLVAGILLGLTLSASAEDSYDVQGLDEELRAAGVPIHGCSSTGRIDYKDEASPAQRAAGAAILAAHDKGAAILKREKARATREALEAEALRAAAERLGFADEEATLRGQRDAHRVKAGR